MADSPGKKIADAFNRGEIRWSEALRQLLAVPWPQNVRTPPSAPDDVGKAWLDAEDDAFTKFPPGSLGETKSLLPTDKARDLNNALWEQAHAGHSG